MWYELNFFVFIQVEAFKRLLFKLLRRPIRHHVQPLLSASQDWAWFARPKRIVVFVRSECQLIRVIAHQASFMTKVLAVVNKKIVNKIKCSI
jgi:hypothetical protein